MRKRIIDPHAPNSLVTPEGNWLPLEEIAEVDLTSEDAAYPIESALVPGHATGWRAAGAGPQTIRLTFAAPQHLHRIWLHFAELNVERTQEYLVRCSDDGGGSFRDVVRQQWNFSPHGATTQTEDHHVDLPGVTVLELVITPGTTGGADVASLEQLRLA